MSIDDSLRIVGPSADERGGRELTSEQVRLADNRPLYLALMKDTDALRPSEEDIREAKSRLESLFRADRSAVLACSGQSLLRARQILEINERRLAAGYQ